jgi:putative transposase
LALAIDQGNLAPLRIRKAFRFRVYPTPAQIARLSAWESALRFLWNLALEQRKLGLGRPARVFPTAFDQINELTDLRAELPWLADVPRNVCAQLLVELDKSWQRCFSRIARAPRFKRRGRDFLGLTEPHPKAWRLDGTILRFPKLGNLRAVVHRPLEGRPKSCTLRREGDQWFASIVCELDLPDPVVRTEPVVGIDRGVVALVADSDGNVVQNPAYLEQALRKLARAQRIVSRRKKGSKNREKAKARVARIHRKIRRQRSHLLHQLSSRLSKSHATVVVEKLQIGNMVRANAALARRILDAGWAELVEMLRYKLAWRGGTLVEVYAAYSSQTCSSCGAVDAASRSGVRFACSRCGHLDHADVNAAKVLKSRANRSALPVEGSPPEGTRRSRKVVALRVPRRPPQSSALSGRS